jgi:hypothetical protein
MCPTRKWLSSQIESSKWLHIYCTFLFSLQAIVTILDHIANWIILFIWWYQIVSNRQVTLQIYKNLTNRQVTLYNAKILYGMPLNWGNMLDLFAYSLNLWFIIWFSSYFVSRWRNDNLSIQKQPNNPFYDRPATMPNLFICSIYSIYRYLLTKSKI